MQHFYYSYVSRGLLERECEVNNILLLLWKWCLYFKHSYHFVEFQAGSQ